MNLKNHQAHYIHHLVESIDFDDSYTFGLLSQYAQQRFPGQNPFRSSSTRKIPQLYAKGNWQVGPGFCILYSKDPRCKSHPESVDSTLNINMLSDNDISKFLERLAMFKLRDDLCYEPCCALDSPFFER